MRISSFAAAGRRCKPHNHLKSASLVGACAVRPANKIKYLLMSLSEQFGCRMIVAPPPNRLRHQKGQERCYAQWQTWIGMTTSARGGDVGKQELFDLAAVCEDVANSIEDR
jgi:hypothetical protein